jgi:hypothetical protein
MNTPYVHVFACEYMCVCVCVCVCVFVCMNLSILRCCVCARSQETNDCRLLIAINGYVVHH